MEIEEPAELHGALQPSKQWARKLGFTGRGFYSEEKDDSINIKFWLNGRERGILS